MAMLKVPLYHYQESLDSTSIYVLDHGSEVSNKSPSSPSLSPFNTDNSMLSNDRHPGNFSYISSCYDSSAHSGSHGRSVALQRPRPTFAPTVLIIPDDDDDVQLSPVHQQDLYRLGRSHSTLPRSVPESNISGSSDTLNVHGSLAPLIFNDFSSASGSELFGAIDGSKLLSAIEGNGLPNGLPSAIDGKSAVPQKTKSVIGSDKIIEAGNQRRKSKPFRFVIWDQSTKHTLQGE